MSNAILGRNATANLDNGVKLVPVIVAAGTATLAASADLELRGGKIIGCFPSAGSAANAVLQSVVLNATTGVVTVTLGANTTNNQTFQVVVSLASGDIA